MNAKQFDELTRNLGKNQTRRGALKLLAGTLLAPFLRFGKARSSSTKSDSRLGESNPSIQLIKATEAELQQFLVKADQDSDVLELRSYFESFGFVKGIVEGARAIFADSSEMKLVTEVYNNSQHPETIIHLYYIQLPPLESVYLPLITNSTTMTATAQANIPVSNVTSVNSTQTMDIAYSMTLDSNGAPILGHYRNKFGEIEVEFPLLSNSTYSRNVSPLNIRSLPVFEMNMTTSAGQSPSSSAFQKAGMLQQSECVNDCKTKCKDSKNIIESFNTGCGLLGNAVCGVLGLLATRSPYVALYLGIACGAAFQEGCALGLNSMCDVGCETVCRNNEQERVICGDRLCAPAITTCATPSGDTEVCKPPEGTCQPNYHYVGHYRFGTGSAPFCCFDGGVNCGAGTDGFWGGCCPGNTHCVPNGTGYICRF